MHIRSARTSDYHLIHPVLNDWWGGRQMTHLLPKLFFEHFQNTSFVVEHKNELIAFLIGFVSQTERSHAYIHFVGVHPDYRKDGLGRQLYETFFETVRGLGCRTVHCITSPVNTGSIAFHTKMGFTSTVSENDAGPGEHRVLFSKELHGIMRRT